MKALKRKTRNENGQLTKQDDMRQGTVRKRSKIKQKSKNEKSKKKKGWKQHVREN